MGIGRLGRWTTAAIAVGGASLMVELVEGEMVCGWHFNDLVKGQSGLVADHGTGELEFGALGDSIDLYEGTDLNAASGDLPGRALGVRGASANGAWLELFFAHLAPVELSFAYRATATGFDENFVQYWTGEDWETIAEFGGSSSAMAIGSGWERVVVSMPGAGRDARLRLVVGGAEGANGIIRFDNMHVTTVPTPGACVLGSLGGLLGMRRRTRRRLHA